MRLNILFRIYPRITYPHSYPTYIFADTLLFSLTSQMVGCNTKYTSQFMLQNCRLLSFKIQKILFISNSKQQFMQKYEILGVIGEGAYGVVLRCRHIDTKQYVAIKKFKESEEDQNVKKTTVREVKVLRILQHENVVKLKEAFRKKGIVYLVFEYVNSNLLQVLEKQPSGLHHDTIRQIIYQVLKGIAYLHSMNIAHRDIKPQNLLVSDKMIVKICDFGFARTIKNDQGAMTDYVATRWYRAPQLLVGAPYSKQVDMWAIGCIFGELIDGMPMFPGENQLDQLFLIQKCLGPLTPDHNETFLKNQRFLGMKFPEISSLDTIQKRYLGKLNQKGHSFIKSLLKMQPSERLTALEALKHPYFDGIRQDDYLKKLSQQDIVQNRITSACETGYDKKRSYIGSNVQQQRDYVSHQNPRSKAQIRRKEDTSRSSNLKPSMPAQHSKSTNKNTGYMKKTKDTTLSLQKHHNRDILVKTQAGFFITPSGEETSVGRNNKIYGGCKVSPKSKQGSRKVKNQQGNHGSYKQMNCTSSGFPFLVVGTQSKKGQKNQRKENQKGSQKINNINIVINHNTWINSHSN